MDIAFLRHQIEQRILVEDNHVIEALLALLLDIHEILGAKASGDADLFALLDRMNGVFAAL